MSMYQALYEKIDNELKELEEKLKELYTKKENIRNDCGKTEEILWEQEDLLAKLEEKRDNMPYRNHFIISVYATIFALIIGISGLALYFYGLTKFLLMFPIFINELQPLVLLFLMVGIFGDALVCSKIVDKFQNKLEKKSIQRIINSKDYQELLSKINVLENDIKITKDNVSNKENDFKLVNEAYETCKKDRDEKKILIEYIVKQMQPTETTLNKSKIYKREN